MSDGEPVRLVLELEPGSEPIVGALGQADGSTVDFTGWLGLASAIEEAIANAQRSASARASSSRE